MKVRHLLNLKIAGITFLLASATLSAFSQETKVYLGNISRVGNLAKAVTADSLAIPSGLEEYYWFTYHEDTAIWYYLQGCTFKVNPMRRALNNREELGYSIEEGKGHTILRYLHHNLDSVRRAMHVLLKYGTSTGTIASNVFWSMQEVECIAEGSLKSYWKGNYVQLGAYMRWSDYEKHSQSRVIENEDQNKATVYFKGVTSEKLPTLIVLEYLLKQQHHSFQENLVQSGICLSADFSFNASSLGDLIGFTLSPNPFAISKSVEILFDELDKMPLFNYTSKDQLDLAKARIAIDLEFQKDRTFSYESWVIPFLSGGTEAQLTSFMDSVESVTKVDIMNLIQTHIQKQPFFLVLEASASKIDEIGSVIKNTQEIDRYKVPFEDVKNSKLNEEALSELEDVAYILNLTSWAPVEVHLYGNKKRTNARREKTIREYLEKAGVTNQVNFRYHRNLQAIVECATFSIVKSAE